MLFWLLSWGINYGSVMARDLPESQSLPALTDAAYWVSPKPIDSALIFFDALDAQHHFEKPVVFKLLESSRSYSPRMSILSSLLLCGALLGLSVYEFNETDY